MTNIEREGSSLIINGDVNSYPFNDGKISLPLNSLYFVIDESNVISFKQVNDNNTLLSININNLQINGEQVTKENLIEKFDSVANGNMGGSKLNAGSNITLQPEADGSITISATGELSSTVSWNDITDKPSTFTPSTHTHLSSEITDLQGKLDAKQDTLVSGTNIKTINGQDILGSGNIEIQGGSGDVTKQYVDEQLALKVDKSVYEADKATFALKTEIPSIDGLATSEELQNGLDTKQDKGDYALKSELPDISGLATKEELASKADVSALATKQDTLVSGTNIKTINGQTVLGEGNIEIQGGGSGISDAPSDDKLYGRKNANWSEIIIPSTDNFATKTEIADMLTKTEAASTYQPKGNYLTEIPSEYITETELSEKGYLTEIPSEYVTDEELNGKGYATTVQLDAKQDTLVSGESIKTVNGESILGSGNIVIEGGSSDVDKAYVDEKLALKADKTSVPTVQSSSMGNENNYVYSIGYIEDKKNVLSIIKLDEASTDLILTYQTWNSDTKVNIPLRNASTTKSGIMTVEDKQKLDSINVEEILTKTEASTTYALQSALQAALERIAALESQVGNISTQLDNINGETIN